jgi:hypothetical protein
LSLEDQGRFFVGYYHQKTYRKEKEVTSEEFEIKTETGKEYDETVLSENEGATETKENN